MARTSPAIAGLVVAGLAGAAAAQDAEAVSFGTNWVAQAEHGGFYQAVADGTYAECGLDVTIVPGGPQVNNRAQLLAGRIDFHMGGGLLNAFAAIQEDIPLRIVAAMFQKSPSVILAHPGAAEDFADLKDLTHMVTETGYLSYYQWLIHAHGFSPENREIYSFNPAPFIADETKSMQGYLTSEPYTIETEAGFAPDVFLLADQGYSTYSTTIETMQETIETRPDVVQCFVDGSIKGWYTYLYGDNAAANAAILKANPEMSQDKIDYAIRSMKENGIVDSGDALSQGIGVVTAAKVEDFYRIMVEAGVIEDEVEIDRVYTTEFVGEGVGLDLKPGN